MLKELKNLFAFLTVLPLHMDMDCLADSAKFMFLFPMVGGLIGLLAGVFGWAAAQILPGLVVGGLALGVLLLLTGLHHADGLLDFGDAVMFHGTAERKIEIMHDQLTGAGALGLGIITYLVTAFAFAELRSGVLIQALVVIELSAKLSMVVGAWAGNAVHKGMSSTFLEAMHDKGGNARLAAALAISFGVAAPLLWFSGLGLSGFVTVLAAVLAGLVMVAISHRHFKGVTGDVLGATNELTRMVAVVVLLAMIR
ncbi:MAG TPA: adenosylcobinamide-GDP ribazoletransferase [Candidatus Bathyarchaeia archaeon]|nr:adenosylcobinamide-GDP ribazoletransferase [Candidatus Bathyarchaeia archaeon]